MNIRQHTNKPRALKESVCQHLAHTREMPGEHGGSATHC